MKERERRLLDMIKRLLTDLEIHIVNDSNRTNVSKKGYCPCWEEDVEPARELVKELKGE